MNKTIGEKTDILSLSLEELAEFLSGLTKEKYRAAIKRQNFSK